jgi:hypothetical protein
MAITNGLLPIDDALARAVSLGYEAGSDGLQVILFQFPPRIVNDGRGADFVEIPIRGDEPVAVYKTSKARKIRMEWTYIVGERGGGASPHTYWSVERVAEELRKLRTYFISADDSVSADKALLAYIKWGALGDPDHSFTCRMENADITYGKTIYVPRRDGVRMAFPLRTDVGVDVKLWTNAGEDVKQELPLFSYKTYPKWR